MTSEKLLIMGFFVFWDVANIGKIPWKRFQRTGDWDIRNQKEREFRVL